MKILLMVLLMLILLLMCSHQEQITPMDCYYMKMTASSVDGHIISTEANYSFTYDATYLEKWNKEPIRVTRDTNRHTVTIQVWQCVLPDSKDTDKHFTERR